MSGQRELFVDYARQTIEITDPETGANYSFDENGRNVGFL
jgi:hypothetical protein